MFLCSGCSLRGHEQVECKFYNELGRVLVKNFMPTTQLGDVPGESEDSDFIHSFSHQDIGKLTRSLLANLREQLGISFLELSQVTVQASSGLTHWSNIQYFRAVYAVNIRVF